MATQKQVNYSLILLAKCGYSVRYMNREYKDLGATMRERRGSVESWLRSKNVSEISLLIDQLKSLQPYRSIEDSEVQKLKDQAGENADIAELRKIAGIE